MLEIYRKRQERWNKTLEEKMKEKSLRDCMRYAATKKATTTAVHTIPVRKNPEEIKKLELLQHVGGTQLKRKQQRSLGLRSLM